MEVKEFWKASSCLAVHMDGPAIWKLFGEYLYPFCISKSWVHFPHFWTRYGLPSHPYLHVWTWTTCSCCCKKRTDWQESYWFESPEECLLFYIRTDPEHKTLYRFYQSLFNYQVVPVSYNNTKFVRLIEYVVGERIVHLNEGPVKAVDFMHSNYHPHYKELAAVSNGGDNIKYGPPKKSLPEWGTLDKKPELQPFINQISRSIKDMWVARISSRWVMKLFLSFLSWVGLGIISHRRRMLTCLPKLPWLKQKCLVPSLA